MTDILRMMEEKRRRKMAEAERRREHWHKKYCAAKRDERAARAPMDGMTRTMDEWQKQAAELAKEFPGLDWSYDTDFIPPIREMKAQISRLVRALANAQTVAQLRGGGGSAAGEEC